MLYDVVMNDWEYNKIRVILSGLEEEEAEEEAYRLNASAPYGVDYDVIEH